MKKHTAKKTKTTTSDTMDTPTPASTITISKDVPMPTPVSRYPFATMEVGDSFPAPSKYTAQSAYVAGKKLGHKFTCRKDSEGVRRVWRTA